MSSKNEVRELTAAEIDMIAGAGFWANVKEVMANTPDSVKFLGAVGAGAMIGAVGGPVGAIVGGAAGGVGYVLGS